MFYYSLEEKQRSEKRTRDAKGQKYIPRWFDVTEEVAVTPWGDLEIYEYNGKYSKHRDEIGDVDVNGDDDVSKMEFNPWQYGNVVEN